MKITMLFMGKLAISMAIFNRKLLNYQGVCLPEGIKNPILGLPRRIKWSEA